MSLPPGAEAHPEAPAPAAGAGAARLARHPGTLWRRVATGMLLLGSDGEEYVHVSGTGAAVWDLLGAPVDVADVVQILAGAYDADAAEVARDLEPVLDQLVDLGVVVRVP